MSSVLETFFLLFESDADKAAKDLEKVDKASDDTADSLEKTSEKSEQANASFTDMIGKLKAVAVAYIGVQGAQAALNLATQVDMLGKTADMWGLNVEELNAWGEAAVRNGGTVDGMVSTIEGLNAGLNEVALTGEGSILPFFNLLGISATDAAGKARTAMDVLPEIADAFEGLTAGEQVSLGQQLGLDDATIRMLQGGRRELDLMIARQKELGVVTKEEAEASAAFNDALADTSQVFVTIGRQLLTAALPAITTILEGVQEFVIYLRDHEELVIGFFTAIGAAILPVAASALAAAAPFILMGAAVAAVGAAFGLLLDDIEHWRNGQDSLLGRALGDWTKFSDMIGQVIDGMIERIMSVIGWIKELLGFGDDVEGMDIESPEEDDEGGPGILDRIFGGGDEEDQEEDRTEIGRAEIQEDVIAGQDLLQAADASPVGALTSSAITNSNVTNGGNSVNVEKVEVHTQATDAEGIASEIGGSLTKQMRATVNTFDDGTKA